MKYQRTITVEQLESFSRAFDDGGGGCLRRCHCGKTYYNPDDGWDWAEGELEELEADRDAFAVAYPVGEVIFDGARYADVCNCWHGHADKIAQWIIRHGHGIAAFLRSEKKRLQDAADAAPTVLEGGAGKAPATPKRDEDNTNESEA